MVEFRRLLWRFLDHTIFLQMVSTFKNRFRDFTEGPDGDEGLKVIEEWRKDQQDEWNRLSMTLALLAASQISTLSNAQTPKLAHSLWLGGAGLSVCGIFIIQYFSIKAFSITDEDMKALVHDGNQYINSALLANAVASPVIIVLWASVLFIAGVIDYVVETEFHGTLYKILAATPVALGLVSVILTLLIGQVLGQRVESRYKRPEKLKRLRETV